MAVTTLHHLLTTDVVGQSVPLSGTTRTGASSCGAMSNAVQFPLPLPLDEPSLLVPVIPQNISDTIIPAIAASKKRKASKSKLSLDVRRATSTPQLRGVNMSDLPMSPTSADKRRNKLGYHRTSVACGHCRRRKIRCLLPSPEDAQGRCANCIRLKKECVFYPVTETGQHERPIKKSSTVDSSSTSNTSPRITAPSTVGSVDDVPGKGSYQQPVRQLHNSATPADGFAIPPTNIATAPFYTHPYPYQSGSGTETWSPNSYASGAAHPSNQSSDAASPYWTTTSAQSASSYQTSPSSALRPPSSLSGENPNLVYAHGAQNWAQPRSLSLGQAEHGTQRQMQSYPYQDRGHEQSHASQLPYPPPLTSHGQPRAATSEQYALISQSRQTYPYPPQQWQGYASGQQYPQDPQHPEYSGQWYAEPSSVARPEEHPSGGTSYGQPGAYYPNSGHPG